MIAISAKIPISVALCFFTLQRHIAELLSQMRFIENDQLLRFWKIRFDIFCKKAFKCIFYGSH